MKSLTRIHYGRLCLCLVCTVDVLAKSHAMIDDGMRGRLSLDGTWQAIGGNGIIPQYPPPATNNQWATIEVPGQSVTTHRKNSIEGM